MKAGILFSLALFFSICFAYGEQKNSFPNSDERQFMTLINAVRISPARFNKEFLTSMKPLIKVDELASLDSRAPLTMSPGLNEAARAFVKQHSDDKVPTDEEIKEFLDSAKVCKDGYAGNTAVILPEFYSSDTSTKDVPQALQFIHHLLCNAQDGQCTETSSDLDEATFLSHGQTHGAGIHNDSSDGTKDNDVAHFVGAETCTGETANEKAQRVSGSHLAFASKKQVHFIATYTADKAPDAIDLLIDKTAYPMKQVYADNFEIHKHYVYSLVLDGASSCRKYIIRATATSKDQTLKFYYPQTGKLATYGDGTCITDFEAGPENNSLTDEKYKAPLKIWVFIVIGAGILVLIVVIIAIVVCLMNHSSSSSSSKDYKKLDDIDNYVAPSLKDDFKSDFGESGPPPVPNRPDHFDD